MKKHWMKALSFVLALVMVLSVAPISFVSATETETEPAGEAGILYEPWGHGYRFVDVLSWDPSTDPYADELVAEVPLAERIDTYTPTQANPDLADKAKLYAISSSNYRSTDVNEAPWNAGMAYDEFSYNLFKFWQYTDMTGAGGRPTEDIARGSADKEYGTIAIPMAAATNAAHKNGVLSIAEYFLPRSPQYTEEWLQKAEDGSYPYADKLLEIMDYYGFDGYFINQEEAIPEEYVPRIKEVMQYMMDRGAYIQWYDSITNSGTISYQNIFNSVNSDFVYDTTHGYGQVSHSIFLNYWYDADAIKNSAEHAESLGLDPYETVYMGLEGGEWRFGIDLEAFWDIMYNHDSFAGNLMDENNQPYTSFAIWGSDFYREQYNKADNNRYKVEYQWEADERERMYFTSPAENVLDYDTSDIRRTDIGFTYEEAFDENGNIIDGTLLGTQTNFKGISRYVVEKSVISGTVFATDFNTGHGMEYVKNGEVIRELEWSNLNLQDILPTWQWWVESADENLLDLEWDYGTEYTRVQGEFPYTQIGAYNGGNSLAIYGDVHATQFVNLYKTNLYIDTPSSISLTYNQVSGEDVAERIVLVLEVDENNTETVYLPIETTVGGWNTVNVPLGDYEGRRIAAIGLEFSAENKVEDYQLNLGRLVVTDNMEIPPDAPDEVEIELNLPETGEYQIGWHMADYSTVKNYHVYAVYADGSYGFVGGAYADEWYISNLDVMENGAEVVALEVRAVGRDGTESKGTQVALNTSHMISNITVTYGDGGMNIHWDDSDADYNTVTVTRHYWYSDKPDGVTNDTVYKDYIYGAFLPVDVMDGERYVLTFEIRDDENKLVDTLHYFGELADEYAAPYDGEARLEADGLYDLTIPADSDWYSMTINVGGNYTTYERFGGTKPQNIAIPTEGMATMIISITDKDGNVSADATKLFFDGVEMAPDGGYGEELIPDPALRAALEEQVGPTVADLLAFTGKLDLTGTEVTTLSGLNLLTGLTSLDLSGIPITSLEVDHLPTSLTEIVLDGNTDLTVLYLPNRPNTKLVLGDLPALTYLNVNGYGNYELNLTGAPELVTLELTGSAMTALDITANTKLEVLLMGNSQIATIAHAGADAYTAAYYWVWTNAKLDLTENTPEGVLFAGMTNYFATTELEERISAWENPIYYTSDAWASGNDLEVVVAVDNGWQHELTSVSFNNSYNAVNPANYFHRYNVLTAEIYVSDDAETWTKVATYEDGLNWTMETCADYNTVTIELPAGTRGRYVKLVAPDLNDGSNFFDPNYQGGETPLRNGYPYIDSLQIDGYFIDYKGFFYEGQQPAVEYDRIKSLTVANDGAEYQTLDLLEGYYASARTVASDSYLRDIEGADWLDAAYVTEKAYMPSGVRVAITKDGAPYVHPDDTLGAVKTEKTAVNLDNVLTHGEYSNEEGWRMFDGMASTKWCGSDSGRMWMAFELADGPAVISEYSMLHAGSESKDYIAWAYRLQVLDTTKLSEAEYLALDADSKRDIAADASYWIDLSVVTGNSENEVTHEIPMENLVSAQVYRFQVDGSGQPGKQTWGALRIYEMELYAFEGNLDNVTNGKLKADEAGVYEVTYNVAKAPINNTRVIVLDEDYETPFTDVTGGWYADPVDWAVQAGITNGTTETTFNPDGGLQRAAVVTMLWRAAGEPEPKTTENPFTDVKETAFYYKAVLWAVEEGITNGMTATTFGPFVVTNRAQAMTFLYRFLGNPTYTAGENPFNDVQDGKWYTDAIAWGVENGVVNGMTGNAFGVNVSCNRAHMVTFLYRAMVD